MATWVTSNTVMLAPKFAMQMGLWGMLAYSTASFGLFLFAPLAFRIRKLMPTGFTSGDFIRLRYGRPTWFLFLVISFIYSMAWLVSMAMAGGIVLQALSGISYAYGMSAILFVCVLYTLVGGLYAVIGTDFLQTLLILTGILVVSGIVLTRVDLADVYVGVADKQPMLLQVAMPVALLSLFNNMFFGFGEVFHNNVWWSRAFAMRGKIVHKAFILAGFLWLPIPVAAGFIGLVAGPLGINVPDPDMAGPLIAATILGSGASVIVFIVIFSSLASSIDSLLAATADLLTEDVYRKLFRPQSTEPHLRRVSGFIIIGIGALTWMLAVPRLGDLIQVLFLSGPLVASTIWPVVSGLYWKTANGPTALTAMFVASVIGLICYFTLGWFTASLISAAVSFVIMSLGTLASRAPFDWRLLNETGSL
jgi:Na+/proline symporter